MTGKGINGKFRFVMRTTHPNAEGHFSIMLEITKQKNRRYISIKIWGNPEKWDSTQERFVIEKGLRTTEAKTANEERKLNNDLIERYNQRANDVLRKFEEDRIDWTVNQFKESFLSKISQGKVLPYFQNHIRILKKTGHAGNAACYSETLRMINKFDRKLNDRLFSEIDIKYVKTFDVFLQERGCKGNTRKYYFKALRAILNKAIQDKEATSKTYPFGTGGFKVAKLGEETEKRYLPTEYLMLLKNVCSLKPVNEYARMLFLFSYYSYGMSFIDMANLRTKNIIKLDRGDYIVYKRAKTKNQRNSKALQIKITTELQEIIDWLIAFQKPLSDFLLPIVTRDYSGNQLHTHIRNRYKKYIKYLKELANELELKINLTSYVSRHTMAMQLQNNSIPREFICQMLGHQDLQVTNTYLDSLDSSIIDEAAKVL